MKTKNSATFSSHDEVVTEKNTNIIFPSDTKINASKTVPDELLEEALLFVLFKNFEWDNIEYVCDNHPHLLRGLVFSNSNTALHEILLRGAAPIHLVHKILVATTTTVTSMTSSNYPFTAPSTTDSFPLKDDQVATIIQNKYGDTPLHSKCRNCQRSSRIISLLVQQDPRALLIKNDEGHIPLTVAFLSKACFAVIQELVSANPSTLLEKVSGKDYGFGYDLELTPTQLLWWYFGNTIVGAMALTSSTSNGSKGDKPMFKTRMLKELWEKIKYCAIEAYRLQGYYNDDDENDKNQWEDEYLCHAIILQNFTHNAHIPLLFALEETSNDNLKKPNNDGDTPLHLLVNSNNRNRIEKDSMVSVLLQKSNLPASMTNKKGQCPLHIAVTNVTNKKRKKNKSDTTSWETDIYPLVQAAPEVLSLQDQTSRLYPFMLAASVDDLDTTFQLLLAGPHVLDASF